MSFRLKTILGIALIEAILLFVLIWSSLSFLKRSNQEALVANASTASTLFASMTKDAVLATDLAALESFIEEILKNPGMVYARIVSTSEGVLAEGGNETALSRPFQLDISFEQVNDGVFDTRSRITEAGLTYGYVEIGLGIGLIQRILKTASKRAYFLAMAEMLLTGLFSFLLGAFLTRQLRYLSDASERISAGDFGYQVPVKSNDELGQTAMAFNRMSKEIERTYAGLNNALQSAIVARNHLEKSEGRMLAILNSTVDGIVSIDQNGIIEMFNPAAEQIFGYREEEVIGNNVKMLMPEPYKSNHDNYLKRYLESGKKRKIGIGREVEGLRKDGATFPIRLSLGKARLSDKLIFTGIITDISERKKAEKALKFTQFAIDHAPENIFWIDPLARFSYVNLSAAKSLGYSIDELEKMKVFHIDAEFDPLYWPKFWEKLKTEKVVSIQSRHITKTGSLFPVDIKVIYLEYEGNEYGCAFIRDISHRVQYERELKQAKEMAEAASKSKSAFLSSISHEMRTPLNTIFGMTELLSETRLDDDQKKYIHVAQSSGTTLMNLINDVLDLSKAEANKIVIESTPFDLKKLISDLCAGFFPQTRKKKLDFNCTIHPDTPTRLLGDPVRLRQVLFNLIGNAIKFTEAGSVNVWVDPFAGIDESAIQLKFSVKDTGIGIPWDKQKFIFEGFSQADASITRKYGGTGLGLAISSRLLELMGSEIFLESDPATGSLFSFTISFQIDFSETKKTEVPKIEPTISDDLIPLKILLVEDVADNRFLIRNFLKKTPFIIEEAENGAIAVTKFLQNRYDIILMDMQMPVMDGLSACREIRGLEKEKGWEQTPVIALTAHAMKEDVQKSLDAGCSGHLTKPVNKKSLVEAIMSYAQPRLPTPSEKEEISDKKTQNDYEVAVDEDLMELIPGFMENRKSDLAQMEKALNQNDFETVRQLAHSNKGVGGSYGFPQISALAIQIESAAIDRNADATKNLLEKLSDYLENVTIVAG